MNIKLISCANTRCGIGRYTNELGNYLATTNNQVHGLRKDGGDSPHFDVYPHRSLRNLRHYIAPYYLSKAIRNKQADIWHADYVDAASSFFWHTPKRPYILFTNVHDAIPFLYPTSGIAFEIYKRQLAFAIKHSYKIVVVSEASKRDLIEFTGIQPEKVEVIYNGINHDVFFPDHNVEYNKKFTIRYVGGLSGPHKNAETLIKVASILEQKGLDFVLEVGGGHPEKTVLPLLADSMNLKSVKFKGFVPDEELRPFLAGADLFLYPSRYEGFGFPPLEAMACGTATVSSNAGSLKEVLGDGAITVQPAAENLAMAAEAVIRQPDLKFDLQRRALKQSAKFTWEKSGEAHLSMYEDALFGQKFERRAS